MLHFFMFFILIFPLINSNRYRLVLKESITKRYENIMMFYYNFSSAKKWSSPLAKVM